MLSRHCVCWSPPGQPEPAHGNESVTRTTGLVAFQAVHGGRTVVARTRGLCSAGPGGQSSKGSSRRRTLLLLWAGPPPLSTAEAPELENLSQKISCDHQVLSRRVVLEVTSPSLHIPGTLQNALVYVAQPMRHGSSDAKAIVCLPILWGAGRLQKVS